MVDQDLIICREWGLPNVSSSGCWKPSDRKASDEPWYWKIQYVFSEVFLSGDLCCIAVLLGLDMLAIARMQYDVETKAVSKFSVLLACQELGWLFSRLCTCHYFGTWYRSHYWRPVIHIWSLFRGGQGNHWQGVGCLFGFSFLQRSWRTSDSWKGAMATLWRACAWGGHGELETRPFFCIGSSILATGTWGGRIFHSFQCMCCSWWVAASRETCLRDLLRLGVSCEAEV